MSRKLHDSEFMQLADLDVNSEVEAMANLFRPSEFTDRVIDLHRGGRNQGAFKPFWDEWGDRFVLRPKELTIVFGSRGSYKSTVINYLIADYLMKTKEKAGLISYEMDAEDLLHLLACQMANSVEPPEPFVEKTLRFAEDRLVMIDEMVDTPHSAIAKLNAMLEMGCKIVVLDCLQRVNMPAKDIDLEREFVVEITNLVRKHNAHAIVVHHSRKGSHAEGDNPKPVIDDLKGSGGLADNAHNVLAIWSDKAKKDLMFKVENGYRPDPKEAESLEMPDVLLLVKKQRKHHFEGAIGLWRTAARAFHRKNQQPRVFA